MKAEEVARIIRPGTQLEKNGIRIHIHEVRNGEVLFQVFPDGVVWLNCLAGLRRMSIHNFRRVMEEDWEIIDEEESCGK